MALPLQATDTTLRFLHVISGILWIGLLYFFNFIGGGFMKKISAETKKEIYPKLMLPALFWFRWAAMSTLVFGVLLYLLQVKNFPVPDAWDFGAYANASWGIHLGMLIALTMWFNVWFIIWPAQKLIIGGFTGDNEAPGDDVARRAFLASRYNTYASVPMLILMLASKHWPSMAGLWGDMREFGMFVLIAIAGLALMWYVLGYKLTFPGFKTDEE